MQSVLEKLEILPSLSDSLGSPTVATSKNPDTFTENGNPAYSTIGKPHLDFYGGVTRQTDDSRIISLAKQCLDQDTRLALPTFFQKRNCRGGAGERKPFILAISQMKLDLRRQFYPLIPQYGYWDDLNTFAASLPEDQKFLANLMAKQLLANMAGLTYPKCRVDRNLEKWLPSEGGSDDRKWNAVFKILKAFNALLPVNSQLELRNKAEDSLLQEFQFQLDKLEIRCTATISTGVFQLNWSSSEDSESSTKPQLEELLDRYNHILKKVHALPVSISQLTMSGYRKWLAYRRAHDLVIEHYKSSDKWQLIDYSKVPSIAFDRTKAQFRKHDSERFDEFVQNLQAGKTKVHVGQLMPFELVRQPSSEIRDEQWKLVVAETAKFYQNVPEDSIFHPKNSISVADVSGSMISTFQSNVEPIAVSKSLAILMAEVGQRPIYTFSGKTRKYEPVWSNLTEALKMLNDENCNTNFRGLIDRIYEDCMKQADQQEIPPSKAFPGSIFIYTDNGFDIMCHETPISAADYIRKKFEAFKKIPIVVFWNVSGNASNFAVQKDTPGIIQLAGFSKDFYRLFTRITKPEDLNPEVFFRLDVLSETYQPVLDVFDRWVQRITQ